MTQTTDGSRHDRGGYDAAQEGHAEAGPGQGAAARMEVVRPTPGPQHKAVDSPVGGPLVRGGTAAPEENGLIEREAAAAVAALEALKRVAHFGRQRPELARRLSDALTRVDDALAEAVRELYGKADESDED